MKLQLLAIPLLMVLMLSPLFAAAATGTVTFTSPAAGTTLKGTAAYSIAGSISPAPTLPDNVIITVTNPSGQVVDSASEAVQAGGAWTTYNTNAGGNPSWVSGTYTITVDDSTGASGTTTFSYQAVSTPTSGTTLTVVANSNSLVYAGQTAQIYALAYWNNGSAATAATWTVAVYGPTGTTPSPAITWTKSSPANGTALWTGSLPTGTADGVYGVDISATESGVTAWSQTSFDVNSQVASASGLSSISSSIAALGKNITTIASDIASLSSTLNSVNSAVGSLSSTVGSMSSQVSSINSAVGGLTTAVGSIQTSLSNINGTLGTLSSTVSTINSNVNTLSTSVSSLASSIQTLTTDVTGVQTTVNGLSGLAGQMTTLQGSVSSLSSSVSNEQTYILVVAVLVVITLVLELAIIIRKMS